MSYRILGANIKNEYLSLGVLLSTAAIAYAATSGSKKEQPAPTVGSTIKDKVEQIKQAIPLGAGSSEEEQFIKKFIDEEEAKMKH